MPKKEDIFGYKNTTFIEQVNAYQGQAKNRLAVNKYTWLGKEYFDRSVEVLDPEYLFFSGDLDLARSTRSIGPILLSLLPAAILGLKEKRQKMIAAAAVSASALAAGLFMPHFYLPAAIPMLVAYAWLAGKGFAEISSKWSQAWQGAYGAAICFDMARAAHDIVFHYLPVAPL